MFYLVEGLNASGKSTWIKKQKKLINYKLIDTSKANPLRWNKLKKEVVTVGGISNYCLGYYEALWNENYDRIRNNYPDLYWDRTFISGYVYYTVNKSAFELLAKMYLNINVQIIFLDTDMHICLERYLKRGIKKYVDKKLDWNEIRDRFHKAISQLKIMGYNIKIIRNYGV